MKGIETMGKPASQPDSDTGESRYLTMDERAMSDPDAALVLCAADSLAEAQDDAKDFVPCVIWDTKTDQLVEYVTKKT